MRFADSPYAEQAPELYFSPVFAVATVPLRLGARWLSVAMA